MGDYTPTRMLTKFETKSNRVKGLSFHPTRSWILASLHNGIIQLWDYRMGTKLDQFEEHEGPVRGVHFHASQPLFVSGGDDYKVKVWNYKDRKCLFTLLGHLDYIRTVQFHHEYPWIVSSSDDQTIRISNWQSRICIAVLTGHNHYVMCAQFHPKEDLLVSASLDQTVRVWDLSGLRKKTISIGGTARPSPMGNMNTDIFGSSDAVVKYVLEGHDRGVNWASFHHTLPLIVSGADDRQIKLWRMNESKAWEVDSLRGHVNNVSCAIFHPKEELILSDSEDKSIRIWDISRRVTTQTFRRDTDRFWILASHPNINLLAAGHDSGMVVFKLDRERPAFCRDGDMLYVIRDKVLRSFRFSQGKDTPVMALRKTGRMHPARSMFFNAKENALLMNTDADGGTYELLIGQPGSGGLEAGEGKKGQGISAVFIARNRFVVLDKMKNLLVKNLKNETVKRCAAPMGTTDFCYEGVKPGTVLLRSDERVTLYDVTTKHTIGSIQIPHVKYVSWSRDGTRVALISKHNYVIASNTLKQIFSVHETIRIKSAAWDDDGVFIYTTLNHLKYALPNGDTGILRTVEVPLYLTAVIGDDVHCMDREERYRVLKIDRTEYQFKLALINKRFDQVARIIKGSRKLSGESIIAYLQRKGYAEVALHFVTDEKTRLDLAIECGNITVALESARALNSDDAWNRVAAEALRQGNHQVVEMAYQNTKNYERLSFLYLITGNIESLAKLNQSAADSADISARFQNALYLGDVEERVAVLRAAGQNVLAYVVAKNHGLDELAESIPLPDGIERSELANPKVRATLLSPPAPVVRSHDSTWPLLAVTKGFFDGGLASAAASAASGGAGGAGAAGAGAAGGGSKLGMNLMDDDDLGADGEAAGWGDDDLLPGEEGAGGAGGLGGAGGDEEEGGWDVEDIALPDLPVSSRAPSSYSNDGAQNTFTPPQPGVPPAEKYAQTSIVPGDHIAAGLFDSAFRMLRSSIAVRDFNPLRPAFMSVFTAAHAMFPSLPTIDPVKIPIHRDISQAAQNNAVPISLPFKLASQVEKLKAGYKLTTAGKFNEALATFMSLLHTVPVMAVDSKQEVADIKEIVLVCKEYVTAIRLELKRKEEKDSPRGAELSALFTHCNLQPMHIMLSLQVAMMAMYKINNFNTASSFAKRLLEQNPKPEIAQKARKLIELCQATPTDQTKLNYDERNPFVICTQTFTPLYMGTSLLRCPYCGAAARSDSKGKLCQICLISEIGAEAPGLVVSQSQKESGNRGF